MTSTMPGPGTAPLVVVADDDPDILAMLELSLRLAGNQVVTAIDGRAAWDTIEETSPDVVVLDVGMPHLTGLEVLARCRADARHHDLPVILLTARAQDRDVADGLAAGADQYLTKPFSPRVVVGVVEGLAARAARRG